MIMKLFCDFQPLKYNKNPYIIKCHKKQYLQWLLGKQLKWEIGNNINK